MNDRNVSYPIVALLWALFGLSWCHDRRRNYNYNKSRRLFA